CRTSSYAEDGKFFGFFEMQGAVRRKGCRHSANWLAVIHCGNSHAPVCALAQFWRLLVRRFRFSVTSHVGRGSCLYSRPRSSAKVVRSLRDRTAMEVADRLSDQAAWQLPRLLAAQPSGCPLAPEGARHVATAASPSDRATSRPLRRHRAC